MGSLRVWDTDWFDRFKKIYTTNISNLSVYPKDVISWVPIIDVEYGKKQISRPLRLPDQELHISKNEEYPKPKYAASDVITLDMPNISDELRVKEEYYAGDTANALGHVFDLGVNIKDGLGNFFLNGTDIDPFCRGILEASAGASASTTINDPGHSDVASALSTAGKWDVYEDMVTDLAEMENNLEGNGFFGQKALLCPGVLRPFLEKYVVDNTAVFYNTVLGYPLYYSNHVDSGATSSAAAIYMIDTSMFELHMTPMKARAFWSNEQETYVWRWKFRGVPVSLPKWNGTDWVKAILGFDVDVTT